MTWLLAVASVECTTSLGFVTFATANMVNSKQSHSGMGKTIEMRRGFLCLCQIDSYWVIDLSVTFHWSTIDNGQTIVGPASVSNRTNNLWRECYINFWQYGCYETSNDFKRVWNVSVFFAVVEYTEWVVRWYKEHYNRSKTSKDIIDWIYLSFSRSLLCIWSIDMYNFLIS